MTRDAARWRRLWGYAVALLAIAAWAVLVLPLLPPPDLASLLLLQLSVVMLVAWYGGLGPGVVATAAAALLIDYLYLPPMHALSVRDSSDVVRLGVFLLEGTLVSYISGSLRAAEARARHGERRLAVAVHSAPLTLYHLDRELRYTWIVNPHPDLAPGPIVGRHVGTMLTQTDEAGRRDIVDFHRTVLQTGRGGRREVALRWSDATRIYDMAVEPLYDHRGAVVGLTGAALDVTDHRRAERALRESEARLRRLVDSNVIGVAY